MNPINLKTFRLSILVNKGIIWRVVITVLILLILAGPGSTLLQAAI